MKPLPEGKTLGIVHSTHVTKEQINKLAELLKIPGDRMKWLPDGEQIHIVRPAKKSELNPNRK